MRIYIITTMRDSLGKSARSIGFFLSLTDAMKAVSNNSGDMYEDGYYPYVVIEEVDSGIYSYDGTQRKYWYRWVAGGYKRILTPSDAKEITNFCIG